MELKASHKIGELSELEQQVLTLKEDGISNREIMADTGLNHSQVERAILKATLTDSDVERFMALGEDLGSRAVAGREQKLSWGVMGILAGVPESKVRAAFTKATELKSQGQRIGKGGRFYYGDNGQPLYEAELKPTGTQIPMEAKYDGAIAAAYTQRIQRLPLEAVRRIAEQYGVSTKGNAKQVAARVLKAATDLAARNTEREAKLVEANRPVAELNA